MIFGREGDLLTPTAHAVGPWHPQQLHGGAPAALLARAAEALAPDMRVARLTVEFLGAVPLAPLAVEAQVVKPGKRFQIVEAAINVAGTGAPAARARITLLRRGDEPGLVPGDRPPALAAGPDRARPSTWGAGTDGFGSSAMAIRFAAGDFFEAGRATAWFRLAEPLVEGERPTPAQRAIAAADFGNGISRVLDWEHWLFVNTDLTVHLHREPVGEWVALDARTTIETDGSGLAVSDLHDERGPIGVSLQTLFVAPR